MIWRTTVDKHHAAMVAELAVQVEAEVTESSASGARQAAESLNQVLRRLRQAPAEAQTLQVAADAAAPWSPQLVVLAVESSQFRVAASRGVSGLPAEFAVENDAAPALASCAESKDPVTVLCAPGQFCIALAGALDASAKVWLFPVVVRQQTVLLMLAAGEVAPAAMELISEAIGMRLEAQRAPTLRLRDPAADVAEPSGGSRTPRAWEDLSPEEQSRHLTAQRVARVRVAELRLADPGGLEKAIFAGNIYSAFRNRIDQAREDFLSQHLSNTPTMVDYLHLELLRSLAHDDERLLGADYPGPMA